MYIAPDVFPVVPVSFDSDKYRIYERNFRIPETKRADKGKAREHSFNVSTSSYVLERHSLKDYVGEDEAENYDLGGLRADVTEELTDVIDRRLEKRVADLFTTTNWSQNLSLASANAFNQNTTVSNPIPVFDTAASTVIQESGYHPNFGILNREGMVAAKNHTSVLDRIKYTSREVTPNMLAALFDLPQLLVPEASFDESDQGQSSSITAIWGDIAFVGYKPARPSPKAPSSGYIFRKRKPPVRRWRDDERDSEAIEVDRKDVPKVIASLSGFLIKDVI